MIEDYLWMYYWIGVVRWMICDLPDNQPIRALERHFSTHIQLSITTTSIESLLWWQKSCTIWQNSTSDISKQLYKEVKFQKNLTSWSQMLANHSEIPKQMVKLINLCTTWWKSPTIVQVYNSVNFLFQFSVTTSPGGLRDAI